MTQRTTDPGDLTGMDRLALEQVTRNLHDALEAEGAERARLQVEVDRLGTENAALRRAITDLTEHIFDAAQAAAHGAALLGRMVTDDQGDPK